MLIKITNEEGLHMAFKFVQTSNVCGNEVSNVDKVATYKWFGDRSL